MSSFSSYDGTRLAYTQVGTGPRLICLPGGPGRASDYLEDLGGLGEERTLVLLDARATGHSEVPVDPSTLRFERLAADVEALRAHLAADDERCEQIDLLGHSAGTVVAQAYAAAHPERIRSLVLVTPTNRLQSGSEGMRSDVPAIRELRSDEPWYPEAAEAAAALADAPPAQQQALMRAIRPFFYGRWDERTQAHAASADRQMNKRAELGFGAGAEEVDVPALLAALGRLDAPVLVLGGERDAATGVEAVHAVAASFARAATAVLPRAGHFPWVDEPEAFRAEVAAFLSR